MQTWLPYAEINRSVAMLDNKRLNAQRNEAELCYRIVRGFIPGGGYSNHSTVRMWKGYPNALLAYLHAVIHEWKDVRGFADTHALDALEPERIVWPKWFGCPYFHAAHRVSLTSKNPGHYTKFGWAVTLPAEFRRSIHPETNDPEEMPDFLIQASIHDVPQKQELTSEDWIKMLCMPIAREGITSEWLDEWLQWSKRSSPSNPETEF